MRFFPAPRPIRTALLILIAPAALLAQPAAPPQAELTETLPASQAATIVYANRPITVLRARPLSSTPAERAAAAVARLDELIDENRSSPVTTDIQQGVLFLKVANRNVFNIVPADLDQLVGETLEQKGAQAADRLRGALAEAIELRTPGRVLGSVGRSLVVTVAFVLLMLGLRWLYRRLTQYLIALTHRRLGQMLSQAGSRTHGAWFASVERRATTVAFFLLALILSYMWITFVLRQFPYTRPWGESMRGYLLMSFSRLGLDIVSAIPGLFMVVVIALVARVVVQLSDRFFRGIERGEFTVPWVQRRPLARPGGSPQRCCGCSRSWSRTRTSQAAAAMRSRA